MRKGPEEGKNDENTDSEDMSDEDDSGQATEPAAQSNDNDNDQVFNVQSFPGNTDEPGPSNTTPAELESKSRDGSDSSDEDSDLEEDISGANRDYRPFRDESEKGKINSHLRRTRNSDSMMSTRSVRSVDPEAVKARVKSQLKKEQDRQKHRRIRKAGEASLVNRSRREHRDNIKQSLGCDWY